MGELAKLEEFERAVYARKRQDRLGENLVAVTALHQCLVALRDGAGFYPSGGQDTPQYTRMASAIAAMFCDPQFVLTQEGFDFIAADRVVIDTIFRASVYNGSDFVFNMVQEDTEHLSKYLLLFSIGSKLELDLETIFRNDPRATFGLWASLVSYGQVVNPESHARRERLLELAYLFEDVVPPACLLNTMTGVYMHCSYASGPRKHDCKRVIHKMMANMMSSVAPAPRLAVRKDRPRLLVINEWWGSPHAMFRSYAKSIRQLRRDFYVIGMRAGNDTDQAAREVFDEWVETDGENMVLAQVAERIKSLQPDMIYYPSIGMAIWTIAMASMRLAPIQVMTYGHPATSNSPEIDFGLIEADCYVPERFAEYVFPLPNNSVRPTEYQDVVQRHIPRKTDTVRIGVSAMQVKISWPFIRAMQEVQRRSPKRIEFWFFSAAHGVGLFSLCRELSQLLQNVYTQEKQPYEAYMESLHQMDLMLFSFPFGGANSCYDTLTVGVPMVSMEGEEPHSRSDASILRRAGLPEWLIAHTEAEYIETVLRLIDDEERAGVAHLVRAVDVEQRFYVPDETNTFVDAFAKIYKENTVVQVPEFPILVEAA